MLQVSMGYFHNNNYINGVFIYQWQKHCSVFQILKNINFIVFREQFFLYRQSISFVLLLEISYSSFQISNVKLENFFCYKNTFTYSEYAERANTFFFRTAMDDPFICCPYDSTHRVPRSRLQKHIVNCEWKKPKLLACPYNATHRFVKEELKYHVTQCGSRLAVFPEEKVGITVQAALTTPKVLPEKVYLPKTDPNHEDWDD